MSAIGSKDTEGDKQLRVLEEQVWGLCRVKTDIANGSGSSFGRMYPSTADLLYWEKEVTHCPASGKGLMWDNRQFLVSLTAQCLLAGNLYKVLCQPMPYAEAQVSMVWSGIQRIPGAASFHPKNCTSSYLL